MVFLCEIGYNTREGGGKGRKCVKVWGKIGNEDHKEENKSYFGQ